MTDVLFDVKDKCVAITGGAGVLGGDMSKALATRGAKIAVLDFNIQGAESLCKEISAAGGTAVPVKVNVLEKDSIQAAFDATIEKLGRIDVLVNAAGGNKKEATCVPPESTFFELDPEAIRWVFDLNCLGTMLPCQIFGKHIADRGDGVIINISSMAAFRPLTRVVGYGAAKAAISNFTEWLCVYMNQNHGSDIRVNAIAPGFFLTEQNRFLLTNEDGSPTPRGKQIMDNTPMGRYGSPDELIGTLVWLISDASKFVTGVVVPVDGGFNAFSGV
ncbi:MAG: SDR family oxidoreductase [Phycisphaerae bacterium]|nr:SDR family oxidoreductase [Phycisphaerae bacterium]